MDLPGLPDNRYMEGRAARLAGKQHDPGLSCRAVAAAPKNRHKREFE
jgi:hypothetical protein